LVRRKTGQWEIFELKTPYEKIANTIKRRSKFYYSTEEHLQQVYHYSDCFEQKQTLDRLMQKYGFPFHPKPRATILTGRAETLDREKVQTMTQQRGGNVDIISYDDVLNALETQRIQEFSEHENRHGLSIHFLVSFQSSIENRGYLMDLGKDAKSNRVSIYLQNNSDIVFEIIDAEGGAHRSIIKSGAHGFDGRHLNYICAEFGYVGDQAHFSLSANGTIISSRTIEGVHFDFGKALREVDDKTKIDMIVGCDMHKKNPLCSRIHRHIVYKRLLTFHERREILYHFFSKEHPMIMHTTGVEGDYAATYTI
jgi:hypothetical protein